MEEVGHAAASQGASKQEKIKRELSLANDIIFLILLRLPTRSIFRFRWVSKQFHSIISDSSFTYSLALRAISSLIIQPKEDTLKDAIDLYLINSNNTSESTWTTIEKPVQSDFSLLACSEGLLCFRAWQYYVFNPCTKKWITVPCINYPKSSTRISDPLGGGCIAPEMYVNESRYLCGFYFHPATGEYNMDSEEFSQMVYPDECNAWYQNHI